MRNKRQEPYFVRMDCGRSAADLHTVYMGNSDIGELVVDWRNSSVGNAYYYSDMLQNSAEIIIALKRIMTFEAAKLLSFTDEINKYFGTDNSIDNATNAVTDSLFLTLLKESRKDEYVHDIIRTIQQCSLRIVGFSGVSHNTFTHICERHYNSVFRFNFTNKNKSFPAIN